MNKRLAFSAAVAALTTLAYGAVHAQSSDSADPMVTPPPILKLADTKKYFVRLGYLYIKPTRESGELRDVSGPVATIDQIQAFSTAAVGLSGAYPSEPQRMIKNYALAGALTFAMNADKINSLGIPSGIKAKADPTGTVALTIGTYFDEAQRWGVEGLIAGVPPKAEVKGKGDNGLDGKKIITTRILAPIVIFNHYFGNKNSRLRASLGVAGTYAAFFDTHSTDEANVYAGGDTKIKLKNAFGGGLFAGLQYGVTDRFHIGAQIGYLKLRSQATATTDHTKLDYYTPALNDYPKNTAEAFKLRLLTPTDVSNGLSDMADYLNGRFANGTYGKGDYGKFVRKAEAPLDPVILWLTVGYNF